MGFLKRNCHGLKPPDIKNLKMPNFVQYVVYNQNVLFR